MMNTLKNKKILFLTGLFPDSLYDSIVNNSKGNIQYAADALQKSLVIGLSFFVDKLKIVNLPFVGSYPKRYKTIRIPSKAFYVDTPNGHVSGMNYTFCNLSAYKMLSRYFTTKNALCKSISSKGEVIIIYAIHTPFLKACFDVKKRNPNIKLILIVPDLPEFMSSSTSRLRSFLGRINAKILNDVYREIDGFVLLSEHMKERLPVKGKRWTVVEGVYNNFDDTTYKAGIQEVKEKYILYTGTLAKRYGILRLVEAFSHLIDPNVKLYICGDGDAKDEILKHAYNDSRIVYKGLIKREEALLLQKRAFLLVNPRTPEGEFTKYSFPSKTMEYLASGVPTLLYRLPGIPQEYYDYCYSITDLSISALTDKLSEILHTDEEELRDLGLRARQFILKSKSPESQAAKIVDLIRDCC